MKLVLQQTVQVQPTALPARADRRLAAAALLGFALTASGPGRLAVYDLLGREVVVLVDGTREAGQHTTVFDAAGLPSGTYLVRLEAGDAVQTQRLTLVR